MSDNVTPIRPEKSGFLTKKRIVAITAGLCVIILIAAIVVVAVQNHLTDFGAVKRYFRYRNASTEESFGTYSFDPHNANRFAVYHDGLAVAGVSGLQLLSDGGSKVYEYHANLTAPAVKSVGDFVLIYDLGGSTIALTHATQGELISLPSEQTILDADLCADGSFCYITEEDQYKAVIPVYNARQKQVYAWYSASLYFNQCALSPDGTMLAAVCIGQEQAAFHSTLMIFSTDSEEPQAELSLGDTLIYELGFVGRNTICAWTEDGLVFVSADGDKTAYFTPDEEIEQIELGGDGFATVLLKSSLAGELPRVATVGTDGQIRASVASEQEIVDISAAGDYVAVLTTSGLRIFDGKLRHYAETVQTGGAAQIQLREDGSSILETSGKATLYLP